MRFNRVSKVQRLICAIGIMLSSVLSAAMPGRRIDARPLATPQTFVLQFSGEALHTAWLPQNASGCLASWETYTPPGGVAVSAYVTFPGCSTININDTIVRLRYTFPSNLGSIHLTSVNFNGRCQGGAYRIEVNNGTVRTCDTGYNNDGIGIGVDLSDSTIYLEATSGDRDHPEYIFDVILNYTAEVLPPTVIPTGAGNDGECKVCSYAPTGDWFADAGSLVNFLVCQIANIYYCHLIPILLGIWRTVFRILLYMQAVIKWAVQLIPAIGQWVNGNTIVVTTWFNGQFTNLGNQISEAVMNGPGGYNIISSNGTNFFDVLVSVFNTIKEVLNGFYTLIPKFLDTMKEILEALIGGIEGVAVALITFLSRLVTSLGQILVSFFQSFSVIPKIIGSFQTAYSAAAANPINGIAALSGAIPAPDAPIAAYSATEGPPSGGYGTQALDCNQGLVYHYCIGAYVLDNTVFSAQISFLGTSASMIGLLAAIMLSGWAGYTILWYIRKFKNLR